jgi:hypothetical protein
MDNNPNWQDKLAGGAILAGFIIVAVVGILFILVTWNSAPRTASSPGTMVGSSTHTSRPPSKN